MEVEARVMNSCSISIEECLDLGVFNVPDIAVGSVLRPSDRLGDTGLLQHCQGNIGLRFSQAVEDDLSQKTED